MKTDLDATFSNFLQNTKSIGVQHTFKHTGDYLAHSICQSKYHKLFSFMPLLSDKKLLYTIPRIGLLVSEVVLLSGGNESFSIMLDPTEENPKGGWLTPIEEDFGRWVKEVEPFIRDGRLIYLPSPVSMISGGFEYDFKRPYQNNLGISDIITSTHSDLMLDKTYKFQMPIINTALPFLENIPLSTLHKVMHDEHDSFSIFRKVLRKSIHELYSTTANTKDTYYIKKIAHQFKADVVEPEIAKINRAYKRIMAYRSIRMAGASFCTMGLVLTAIFSGNFPSLLSAIFGVGGVGAIAKEYAEYRTDIEKMKEQTWHMAWVLKKKHLKRKK